MSDWNPGNKYQSYLDEIDDILGEEQRTVRDVYYAMESRGFPDRLAHFNPDWEFKYRFVKRAVKKGRRAGFIDPELIVDGSRQAVTDQHGGWDGPGHFYDDVVDGIWNRHFENPWGDQDTYVEVWLEKQSLGSVFEPICSEYNVRLEATRGDWSDSKVYRAKKRLGERLDDGDDVKVLYFGDFNPSGLHAPCAVQGTMEHYGLPFPFRDPDGDAESQGSRYFDIWPWNGPMEYEDAPGSIEFERVAINLEHVERFDLPENPNPSSSDKDRQLRERFMEHASDGRDVNIELNALKEFHREFLEDLLEESITQHIDDGVWSDSEDRTIEGRKSLKGAISIDRSDL